MEVEDEYKLLQRLFFKKYGRALPKKKSDEVDLDMDLKDLIKEQGKMNAIPIFAPVDIVKKESIEIDDTAKTAVHHVEEVEKVACFSLRQAPSEGKSDLKRMSYKQTSLLRKDIKSQDETSVHNSWRLNLEEFIDSIRAAAKRKSEMKFPNYSSRREWRTLHQRTKEIINALIRISEHLERIEMNKTTVEVTRYLNCTSRLTKIIPELLEKLTDHFVPEGVYFCKSPPKQMDLIDLTKEEDKEMKNVKLSIQVPLPVVVKTKPIEIVAVRKSLRKKDDIPEKEIPEDVIAYNFVRERKNFCKNTPNQEEDDKGRKDVANHTAKHYKLTSEGASSMPVGLTPRPDPNRTQQGPYAHTGQYLGQYFRQLPQMFPNTPPMTPNLPPLQQHHAEAGYPKRLPLTINFNGILKLKILIFDGELSEYQKFKLTFNTAYDNGRNLPKQHLVSLLEMSLQGKPLKLVSDLMQMGINDKMYACMWKLLDDRFGDRNTEDEFTVGLFKDTLPIKNGSLTEVERIYEIFLIQHAYYLTKDPASLTMGKSLLFRSGKEKLNEEFFIKFVYFTEKYKLVPNFTALITFMQAEFLFAQKRRTRTDVVISQI
jgi:hypothetical protein